MPVAAQQGRPTPPQATQLACPPGVVAGWHRELGARRRIQEQQGLPAPPQDPQAPFEHVPKATPQVGPQAPQVEEVAPPVEATQQAPSEHRLPGQHDCPAPPHAVQVEPPKVPTVHLVLLAVHVLLLQHGSLTPPQLPQAPLAQVPPPTAFGQVAALAIQAPLAQHPPPVQTLPAQHTWPAPPQVETVAPPVPKAPPVPSAPPVDGPPAPPVRAEEPAAPPVSGTVPPDPPVPTANPPEPRAPPV